MQLQSTRERRISVNIWSKKITYLVEHLPCVLTTSHCKASSMNPNLFRVWHPLAYKDGHSPLHHMNTRSSIRVSNVDTLSRLLLPNSLTSEVPIPSELVLLMEHMSTGPLTAAQVKSMTQRDPILSCVLSHVLRGWPTTVDSSLNPYSMGYLFVMVVSFGGTVLLFLNQDTS